MSHSIQPLVKFLFGSAVVLCAMHSGAAEFYRWVDEDGVVNYTQQKPRDIDSEALTTQAGATRVVADQPAPAPVDDVPAGLDDPLTTQQQNMLDELQQSEQQRLDDIARVKEENCMQSRSVLSRLTIKDRIRVRDDNGGQRIMAEDERQSRIAEAQQGIARFCDAAS